MALEILISLLDTERPALMLVAITSTLALAFVVFHVFPVWWRLRHVPGPFLASLSDIPRMLWVTTKKAHLIHQRLHDKYGEVVRVGPNTVIFRDPTAIPTVYPMRAGFPKGDFYAVLRPYQRGSSPLVAVFNSQDEQLHKQIKSPIAPLFSLTNASKFEILVDDVLAVLKRELDSRFATTGQVFDLGDWCQFFAFDVMGTMTFSKRYGFVEEGRDVGGMLNAIQSFMKTVAPMTQSYFLDKIIYKNRVADAIRRAPGLGIMQFVGSVIGERRAALASGDVKNISQEGKPRDFLSHFLEIQETNKELPPWASTAWTFSNVTAGSDSVGTVIRTCLYHLLTNPTTLEALKSEIEAAKPSSPFPRLAEVRDLPYLDACVQEAARLHPPFALPFERVAPEAGVDVLGVPLPGGTVIGGSPYVVNRDKNWFGDDAELWRPERWMVDDQEKKRLERGILTFGAGRRVCLGKALGLMEVKKLIPFLIMNYDIRISDSQAFQVENIWFFKQKGLYTQIEKR
ncbi:putative benzoate 4-monooxygenase cytochrome P450 [Pestalotiopsis sp. NC0098]|nr:putative benzoate 4-monooxygenase cytochrome P450 [Pestalotiopsis sp. NC0098]